MNGVDMNNNTVYEWILHSTFTVSARQYALRRAKPHLSSLFRPGDEILDLCCGTGFFSFWFEQQGASVTALDFAPYMIALAKEEAARHNSNVNFLEADIFTYDFGRERFDLILCIDSVSDFPVFDFAKLVGKVTAALKPGGRFVVQYVDGIYRYMWGDAQHEGVFQESPERISYRFKEYLPEAGAKVNTIRNETRGEEYDRRAYIYTAPVVQLATSPVLELEQRHVVLKDCFLDVFTKRK